MEPNTIEMKIKAIENVLKKYKLSDEKIEAIKTDYYNSLIIYLLIWRISQSKIIIIKIMCCLVGIPLNLPSV